MGAGAEVAPKAFLGRGGSYPTGGVKSWGKIWSEAKSDLKPTSPQDTRPSPAWALSGVWPRVAWVWGLKYTV